MVSEPFLISKCFPGIFLRLSAYFHFQALPCSASNRIRCFNGECPKSHKVGVGAATQGSHLHCQTEQLLLSITTASGSSVGSPRASYIVQGCGNRRHLWGNFQEKLGQRENKQYGSLHNDPLHSVLRPVQCRQRASLKLISRSLLHHRDVGGPAMCHVQLFAHTTALLQQMTG